MIDNSDEIAIESILASGIKFPPRPDVLVELEHLNADLDASPGQYAEIISRDPMLAGAMFRVANSPVFSLSTKVEKLDRAVFQIGTKNTMSVVRSEALRTALNQDFDNPLLEVLWQRQLATAELSVRVARAIELPGMRLDLLYLLGIFHDCGVALLAKNNPDYGRDYLRAGDAPDLPALDAAHGANHAAIGKLLAMDWQLPTELAQAIRQHHQADLNSPPELVRNMIHLLQFATHLLARRQGVESPEWQTWREAVNRLLGVDDAGREHLETELLSPPQ
jgi:HD-like signal output (HDOD) protein